MNMKRLLFGIILVAMLTGCSDESYVFNNTCIDTKFENVNTEDDFSLFVPPYEIIEVFDICQQFNDFYDGYTKILDPDKLIVHDGNEYYKITNDEYDTVNEFTEIMERHFTDSMIERLYPEERTSRCFYKHEDGSLYAYWGSVGNKSYADGEMLEIMYDNEAKQCIVSVEYKNYYHTKYYGEKITHLYYISVDPDDGLLKLSNYISGYDAIDNQNKK